MKDNWYRSRSLFAKPAGVSAPPPRRHWFGGAIAGFIRRVCTVMGAMMLISMGVTLLFLMSKEAPKPLTDTVVLYLPLDGDYEEFHNSKNPFGNDSLTMRELIDTIDHAAADKRVKGIIAMADGASLNLAHAQDVHDAILRFRASGKFAYIYASSYGEGVQGVSLYALASAFNEIWMQPMGVLAIPGVKAEIPFARGTLDKLGVEPQFFARKEYKTIFESATNDKMSDANREETASIVNSISTHLVKQIIADRKIKSPDEFLAQVDGALYVDQQAVDAKLVDRLGYIDQLEGRVKKDLTGKEDSEKVDFTQIEDYAHAARVDKKKDGKKDVALVYAVGTVGSGGAISEDIADTVEDIADDKDIKVIVLRVDSPGGAPDTAETIRHALTLAQKKHKKVIVSMGGMAASGGYWIAANADRIFASPLTLTGSIGVAGGKVAVTGLWDKLGVHWDSVQWGENAGIWSFNEKFSESGNARMNALMDTIYKGFVTRVAEGRKMPFDKAEGLARGRVWTGEQAQANGLVDEIGGLDKALDYVAREQGKKSRFQLNLDVYPRPENAFDKLESLLATQAGLNRAMQLQTMVADKLVPWVEEYKTSTQSRVMAIEHLEVK
jgi:protease-4